MLDSGAASLGVASTQATAIRSMRGVTCCTLGVKMSEQSFHSMRCQLAFVYTLAANVTGHARRPAARPQPRITEIMHTCVC